jgi:hypothetical protein
VPVLTWQGTVIIFFLPVLFWNRGAFCQSGHLARRMGRLVRKLAVVASGNSRLERTGLSSNDTLGMIWTMSIWGRDVLMCGTLCSWSASWSVNRNKDYKVARTKNRDAWFRVRSRMYLAHTVSFTPAPARADPPDRVKTPPRTGQGRLVPGLANTQRCARRGPTISSWGRTRPLLLKGLSVMGREKAIHGYGREG